MNHRGGTLEHLGVVRRAQIASDKQFELAQIDVLLVLGYSKDSSSFRLGSESSSDSPSVLQEGEGDMCSELYVSQPHIFTLECAGRKSSRLTNPVIPVITAI